MDDAALCHRTLEDDTLREKPQDIHPEEPDIHLKDGDYRKVAELNSHRAAENTVEKRDLKGRLRVLEALVIEDMPHTRI